MEWQGKKVCVTGATGFIGGTLAEQLAVLGAEVTGLGRRLDSAAHLQEAGVQLKVADLLDENAMRAALQGQDIVYHLAAWLGQRHGGEQMAHRLNVTASENLVRWAADAGVSRLVLVSSIAVYGMPAQTVVTEATPTNLEQESRYGRTKAQGDIAAINAAAEAGLPLVIVRPGMVYGPRSRGWTVQIIMRIQKGTPTLIGGGKGHSHPVYIKNLVDGMLLAGQHPAAAGETFNFTDGARPWHEFCGYYARMCNRKLLNIPLWLARFLIWGMGLFGKSPGISRDMLRQYTNKTSFPDDKARRLLGYQPRYNMDAAMEQTRHWLVKEGYLGEDKA